MVMPAQKPGRSKQDYETPPELITAVAHRFGNLDVDLAADHLNTKAPVWFSERENSLVIPWHEYKGMLWLNPPFGDIAPWAEKCKLEMDQGASILLLTPASVGSNWFRDHVHRNAMVFFLSPRLTFVGCDTPYPKDIIISYFHRGVNGYDTWRWKP